ncbi:MAG: IS982 family transposase [Acidobacteriota bacterium]|nr:IS982 family transposase [Acidobacteriota bacterium]
MHADLDLLLISVYCTADDLLPARPANARRRLSDPEIVTLAVAQVLLGIPSDRRFLRSARRQLGHLFPELPSQDAFHKRRARLGAAIERLSGVFAARSPGYYDSLLLLDSTPVECGRSVETTRRSQLADAAGYGYCKSHSRWFWGMRLHLACAADGTPRAATLIAADRPEREVALPLLARCLRGGETIVCDKGYAGRDFAAAVHALGAMIVRPRRRDEPGTTPHLAPIRQRIESVFQTCKDVLSLERHGARTLHNLAVRVALRLLALAACISLNHQLGRPSRALADYTA